MITDAGQQLAFAVVGRVNPAGQVQLPQRHRRLRCHRRYLRLCAWACGVTKALRTSTRCTVARDGTAATPRCAISKAIRRAPHRGCARPSSNTSASVSAASGDGEGRGRRRASRSPSIPAAACLAFHEYTDCRDTPYRTATSLTATRPAPLAPPGTAARSATPDHALVSHPPPRTRSDQNISSDAKHLPTAICQACGGPSHNTDHPSQRLAALLLVRFAIAGIHLRRPPHCRMQIAPSHPCRARPGPRWPRAGRSRRNDVGDPVGALSWWSCRPLPSVHHRQ